jgi:hypothetical protein
MTPRRKVRNEGISSPGAIRMPRARWRKGQGALFVSFVVGADAIAKLIELGWLDPEKLSDRDRWLAR